MILMPFLKISIEKINQENCGIIIAYIVTTYKCILAELQILQFIASGHTRSPKRILKRKIKNKRMNGTLKKERLEM